jgi:hypothetical protein
MDPTNGIIALKGTTTVYSGHKIVSSDGNSIQFGNGIAVTGSIISTVTPLVSGSSQISYTGLSNIPSGIISSSTQLPSGIVSSSLQVTGYGFSTTGSNVFVGSQVITGSLYITTDLVVQGCSSLQNITASAVSIGTNTVMLNTATPAVRFAGISVQDSGSNAGVTGSIFWDGLCNRWIYSNPSDIGYSGGMLLSGPRTATLGSEAPLTCNYIAKSGGGDHLYDSCIYEMSGSVGINCSSPGFNLDINGVSGFNSNISSGANTAITATQNGTGYLFVGKCATSNRFRVGPTGFIIVDENSNNAGLTINQSGAGYSAIFCGGNVGIDITAPTLKLDVRGTLGIPATSGTSQYGYLRLTSNAGSSRTLDFGGYDSGRNYAMWIQATDWADLSVNSSLIINPNGGNVGIGTCTPGYKLDVNGEVAISPNTAGKNTFILTTNASNDGRLLIKSDTTNKVDIQSNGASYFNGGNVGIGITSPSTNLDINSTAGLGGWTGIRLKTGTSSVQSLSMGQVTAGNGAWIGMAQYNQGGYWQTEGTAAAVLNFESDGVFRISTNSGLTANTNYNITERLRITSGGNIGINCTTPNYKLHVNGCTAIDGNLRMGGGFSSGNSTDPSITVQGFTNAGVYFTSCGVGLGGGSSTNLLFLSCLGNVSIGTESAYGKLSVVSSDDTILSSALWGGSLAGGIHATIYNYSQCVNSVAGLKLITRNSGASHWSMYNVSTGGSTGDLIFGHGSGGIGCEMLRIVSGGNIGLSTVAPASLLSAYNTTSTTISQMYISNNASNGTGGGNRGFDTSFTSTVTSFTGTDSADQGYGYFPVAIVNGQTYTIHFKSTVVNGTLGTIITSTGTNFATDAVQTISLPTITDSALTSIRFTATGTATYIGFAGYRTSGTMSLTISEVSIVKGIPDIETGAMVAYKGITTNRINIQAPTTACIPALGCADCTTGLIISNFDTRYGMLLGSLNTGTGWIQQGRFDGTATSYPLSLNPNGGKVGIGATSPNWLLEICCNTTATGGGGYPAISINNPNDAGYSAYYFFKGAGNMGGMEVSNATCGLLLNTLCTLNFQTNNNTRIRICNTGESYFTCKPSFPGATLTCTYTCTFASYTAGTWLGLFAGDNGYNGAYAFTVVGPINLGGSAMYSMNFATVPYIHSSSSIGSTNGNDFYGIAHTSAGHADNGALVCFRRARYSGNTPAGNRTEICMNVSYSSSFTATTYVLAWV